MTNPTNPPYDREALLSALNKLKGATLEKPKPKEEIIMEKLSKDQINQRISEFMAPLGKSMWAPQVQEVLEPQLRPDITQSKYFGTPWLYAKEGWPAIGGLPALFVLQLNIATLPKEMSQKLGGKGLVQFFYQTSNEARCDWDERALVRVVDTTKQGKTLPQPKVDDYLIPTEKLIVGWEKYTDFPHGEDLVVMEGYEELEALAQYNGVSLHESLTYPYQGDKLGGWPFWTQASEGVEYYLYQIDAGCFFEGLCLPSHAPELFASDGTGHIYINPKTKDTDFIWACT